MRHDEKIPKWMKILIGILLIGLAITAAQTKSDRDAGSNGSTGVIVSAPTGGSFRAELPANSTYSNGQVTFAGNTASWSSNVVLPNLASQRPMLNPPAYSARLSLPNYPAIRPLSIPTTNWSSYRALTISPQYYNLTASLEARRAFLNTSLMRYTAPPISPAALQPIHVPRPVSIPSYHIP